MIPLRDTVKTKTFPFVNYLLITACGLVFLYETTLGRNLQEVFLVYGAVPGQISQVVFHGHFSLHAVSSIFTAMFLHGGWMHLVGNMLYLYIFGDNIEDRLGHIGYLVFYLLSGAGAAVVQVYANQHSALPLIGASGAIAGVLGAFFILYPRARVLTMIPLFVFFPVVEISAFFFLGFWFILQFLQGYFSSGSAVTSGGVAWWAHAGGFVVGALLLPVFLLIKKI